MWSFCHQERELDMLVICYGSKEVHNFVGDLEVEPDIKNMTLEKYLKYESEKERNEALEYPNSDEEIVNDAYYKLPPLKPYFQTPQPRTKYVFESSNENYKVDNYVIEEVLDDLFRVGADNLRGMKQEEVQLDGLSMLRKKLMIVSLMATFIKNNKQNWKKKVVDQAVNSIEKEKEGVEQHSTSQYTLHITPPNDDYVAPSTILVWSNLMGTILDGSRRITRSTVLVSTTRKDQISFKNSSRRIIKLEFFRTRLQKIEALKWKDAEMEGCMKKYAYVAALDDGYGVAA
ncbi:hypothetical protein Tco_0277525 [Tanacetum coccineum]